jgi:hypothetical protein
VYSRLGYIEKDMVAMPNVRDFRYLIIGGTTKAATTSLFTYLKEHPKICGSSWKETRFFLNSNYPLPLIRSYEKNNLDAYNEFFRHCCEESVRVEATPDYLYSAGTPEKIRTCLPSSKIIFILRDPVDRLISWYKFAKERGMLAKRCSFEEYVRFQVKPDTLGRKQHTLAMEQGRYFRYIKRFYDEFGEDRICVVFFEDISLNPREVTLKICKFAGIDPGFYKNYEFKVFNKTFAVKNAAIQKAYNAFRFHVRKYTHNRTTIHSFLNRARLAFETFYMRLNSNPLEAPFVSKGTMEKLKDYYWDEADRLATLIGEKAPWEKNITMKNL